MVEHSQSHELSRQDQQVNEREGLVVWDQKGLVVLWPDGHCCRFSWELLRQFCQCAECLKKREQSPEQCERPFH